MAFMLSEYAKLANTPELNSVVMTTILRYSQIMDLLRWENTGSFSQKTTRWNTLPSTGFRKINGVYTASEGTYDQVWESVYAFGGKISWDRAFELVTDPVRDPVADQVEMKLKSLALTFNHNFINGDHATDADGFEGLKKRISLMPSRQTVYPKGAGSTSAPLDPTASAANARAFIGAFDKAMKYCNGDQCNAIFMNENSYLGFSEALRYASAAGLGLLDVTKDSFERRIVTYRGVPFIDVGLKSDQTTEIITDTETDGTGGSIATSYYFVSYDPLEGVSGIQLKDMDVLEDVSGGPTAPAKVVDWFCGLASWGKSGIVRLANVESTPNWT